MIRIERLSKDFKGVSVLKDITVSVRKGQVIALLGPSGSGKSTLLRCINFLEVPTQGRLWLEGTEVINKPSLIEKVRQHVGMVFQHFHLFPHMTVLQNISYAPIKVLKLPQDQAEMRSIHLLKKVGLEDKADSYPSALSGGQKQRVAIARALAMEPKIMLFDEPTSALDPEMVKEVLHVIRDLVKAEMTLLIATHEMNFARDIADEIWFLDKGVLLEQTKPQQFFKQPQTARARIFLEKVL